MRNLGGMVFSTPLNLAATWNPGTADDREGNEVTQLYLREDVSSAETPSCSLEGFQRIHPKPQATRSITFLIPQEQLAEWND